MKAAHRATTFPGKVKIMVSKTRTLNLSDACFGFIFWPHASFDISCSQEQPSLWAMLPTYLNSNQVLLALSNIASLNTFVINTVYRSSASPAISTFFFISTCPITFLLSMIVQQDKKDSDWLAGWMTARIYLAPASRDRISREIQNMQKTREKEEGGGKNSSSVSC